ncbi:MAG: ABC transporter permease subunit [Deltaproteobacteria bacterium]|nr:ABC transporter permease subunit [Deltaproteobacteria bacterium]
MTAGGVIIIGAILAILFVIVAEVYPLLRPAAVKPLPPVAANFGAHVLAIDTDEYRALAVVVAENGVHVVSLVGGAPVRKLELPALGQAKVTAVSAPGYRPLALGLSDGRVLPLGVSFSGARQASGRQVEANVRALDPLVMDPVGQPIRRLAYVAHEGGSVAAATVSPKQVLVVRVAEETSLLGATTREETRRVLDVPSTGEVSTLAIDSRGDHLYIGTTTGELAHAVLRAKELRLAPAKGGAKTTITVLGFLIGDRTLVVGDQSGGVATWQLLPGAEGEPELVPIHAFPTHHAAVVTFSASRRHKGFWTGDGAGELRLDYATTGETLLRIPSTTESATAIAYSPKSDGLVAVGAGGRLLQWDIDCPHPEVSLRALFGKLWYEGYDRPAYVWQSTGGSDDFEAKLSLTPLLFGTLKGTFYALLVAVPIALASALYASQFMHPRLKAMIKPTVEIMAALPSVVLGFLAGLWLAPTIERIVPGIIVSPVVTSALVLMAAGGWRALPEGWRSRLTPGTEVFLLIPVVIGGLWLSFACGHWIDRALLGGDYRVWLREILGVTYDQRNSIVVGLAMGFAVVPVIFTIAEDSLSNVPPHLTAGSLALGATRWQTAVRVVLPSASPGIFSAIMIGFGRAVGETMIVLMATGNTPVTSWSIFNGFRALSANIAVELPEAPQGGTLFRVLFVAALLLFVMTFAVNTAAELVRLRLRERYRAL